MKEPVKIQFCMKPGGHFNYPFISRVPVSSNLIRILSGIFIFFVFNFSAYPQGKFSTGLLPKVNLSYAFPKNIKIVGGYESRQAFFERDKAGEAMFYYDYLVSDISALISLKTGYNKSLSGGFLMRIQGNQVNYRFLQQFSLVSELDAMRIGQRFATDQTLKSDGTWEYRGRYRFTLEKPLSGDNVDPGEFYFKISNEYLFSKEEKQTDLEIRITPQLGFELTRNSKIEVGPDYRVSEFINSSAKQAFWMSIGIFLSLKG